MNRPVPHDDYMPRPEHHFTFGLWTVGNVGRDPFGEPVRPALDPVRAVHQLAQLGAYGVNLHDDDLVPSGTAATERDRIVKQFKAALQASGMKVPMATTNLFSDPCSGMAPSRATTRACAPTPSARPWPPSIWGSSSAPRRM